MNTQTRRGPRQWSEDEWSRILEVVRDLPSRKSNGKNKLFNRAAFWLAFLLIARDTGLSRVRILKLRKSQVAPNGTFVEHFTNPDRDAILRLKPDTMQAIAAADASGRELVKPFATHSATFSNYWKRIVKAAGFSRSQRLGIWCTEVQRSCNDTKTTVDPPKPEGDRPETLLAFYVHFYAPLRLRGRSARTDQLYRFSVRNFGRFLGRDATLDDLNDMAVSKLLDWMRSRGLSVASIEKERVQLLAFWRHAVKLHFLREYPNVPPEIVPDRVPVGWMMPELAAIFKAAGQATGKLGKVPIRCFWLALLWTLYDSGERISAVMNLSWENYDLTRGYLRVPAELRKGKRGDKLFSLRLETVAAMRELKSHGAKIPFEWPLTRTSLWSKFGEVLKAAGLPAGKRDKFHKIRRTVASYFEAAGQNATKLLGHYHRRTTEQYIDPRISKPVHAADVLPNPLLAGNGGAA